MDKNGNFLALLFSNYKWKIALCCLFVLLWTLLEGILLYTIKIMVDYNFDNLALSLTEIITIFICIYFLIELLIKSTDFIIIKSLPTYLEELQKQLAKTIIYQDSDFYQDKRTDGMAAKIVNLSNIIENISKTFLYGCMAGVSGFAITIMLISISSTWLALCFFLWFFAMLLIGIVLAKRNNYYSVEFAKSNNALVEELNDILSNFITVKTFKREAYELNRYSKNITKLKNIKQKLELFLFNTNILRSIVSVIFFILVIFISSKGIAQNQTTLGDLVFVISASLICKKDIWSISLQIIELHKNWGFVQDVLDLLKSTKQNQGSDKTYNSEKSLDNIEFKNIYFNGLIKNISLNIAKGEKVAIIGPSGSGKTTMSKLIACLYSPSSGKLLLNSEKITSESKHLSKQLVYIDQNVSLFDRSIGENIFYNQDNIDLIPKNKIKNITSLSLCNNFINNLPNKLSTKVRNLSSGQKHLVAIARVMNESPEWIILDEPCTFLDPVTEEKLIKNILTFSENKTLIVVTHSSKILKLMDRILVIDGGKITADSKFKDIQQNEFYRKFISYGE